MGEVEQMRKATASGRTVDASFAASDDVERALIRDVQTAWRNLTGYLARRRKEASPSDS